MVISMLKIRRPLGRLIFNMGIAIPGKTIFLIETAPRCLFTLMAAQKLMITIIRGGVTCYNFFRIWKFEYLANFWNFSALPLKKKSTVLDGFFPYVAQMITNLRGCVAYNDLWPWHIFKVIWPWTWKSCPLRSIYSSWWILSIFDTNDH